MYYRLYASKGNTIFQQYSPDTTTPMPWSLSINTGQNPVMEIMDGSAYSKVLLGFVIPDWLRTSLLSNSYVCSLKLYDAGAIYDSLLPMKEISVEYFSNDFSEGNGWSFNQSNAIGGISNWVNNLDNNLWSDVTFSNIDSLFLNKDNQDLIFDVTSSIAANISDPSSLYNYAISVVTPQTDQNILVKFLYGKYTKTIFQPYLEFIINDEILDSAYNMMAGQSNNLYFINENGINFSNTVTASVTLNDNSVITPSVIHNSVGVYYINITPLEPARINKKEYIIVTWAINDKPVYKQVLDVKPQNLFITDIDYRNILFYPTTPYTHNIVRIGDIIPFKLVSQIRGQNDVILDTYEYRLVSQDGFEFIPWTPVSVYRNNMYFYINTSFLYPENQYEVFIRNKMNDFQITSNTTHRFKLTSNEASHLRELSATPYFSRETFFSK